MPGAGGQAAHNRKEKAAKIAQRRAIVVANLLAGANYREIADSMDTSVATVARDVEAELKRWAKENVKKIDQHVQIELKRIDVLMNAYWKRAKSGTDDAAAKLIMDMQKRKMELLKVDFVRVDLTTNGKEIPAPQQTVNNYGVLGPLSPEQALMSMALYQQLVESMQPVLEDDSGVAGDDLL